MLQKDEKGCIVLFVKKTKRSVKGGSEMKKVWLNAEMTELEIKETAGGPVFNMTQDGAVWWNPDKGEKGEYEIPVGEDDKHSA